MRACTAKRAHQQQRDATSHLADLVAAGALPHRLRTYHCRHCGAWHVGHWNQGAIDDHPEYGNSDPSCGPFLRDYC
jgi:hypothetical protein